MEMQLSMEWDEPEAKGRVKIEEGSYGAWIYVDDWCVAMIDLFHLADAGEDEHGRYPQIVIYSGYDWDDPACHAMILKDRVRVRFENYNCSVRHDPHGNVNVDVFTKGEDEDEIESSDSGGKPGL